MSSGSCNCQSPVLQPSTCIGARPPPCFPAEVRGTRMGPDTSTLNPGVAQVLADLPADSLGAYVISMARTSSDVLAVILLQVRLPNILQCSDNVTFTENITDNEDIS